MPTTVEAFRIFIASPAGLDQERQAVRDEIARFNDLSMHEAGAAFTAAGWEAVAGGGRRPQELINEHLETCDYLILLLCDRWGTPPSLQGNFTSGTEEEFRLADELRSHKDKPMTDILILFKGVSETQLSDPGEQLQKVLAFKKDLQDSKEWFYKTFDDIEGLRREVGTKLLSWAKLTDSRRLEPQTATGPKIESTSTGDEARAADSGGVELRADGRTLLELAETYALRGLRTQAETTYAKATAEGDVNALESYSRFLRQTGRLAKSLEVNKHLLDLLTDNPATTAVQRAKVMTNIGITQRKQGQLRESRYSLQEAIQTIGEESDADAFESLAYALDNLGITQQRGGDVSAAQRSYEHALALREETGDLEAQAKTRINLARLQKRSGDLGSARENCEKAISTLEQSSDKASLAGALSALGEILEAESDLEEAEKVCRRALEINETLGRPDNIALSLSQVARVLIDRDRLVDAERYAERALEENERTSNYEGTVASWHLLGRIMGRTGREQRAIGLLENAVSGYRKMGNPTGEGWALLHQAEVLRKLGQAAEATEAIRTASRLADDSGNAALSSAIVEL